MTELFRRHRAKRAQGKKGFTLIELIIVIAILAVLGTVVGVVVGGELDKSKKQAANSSADIIKTKLEGMKGFQDGGMPESNYFTTTKTPWEEGTDFPTEIKSLKKLEEGATVKVYADAEGNITGVEYTSKDTKIVGKSGDVKPVEGTNILVMTLTVKSGVLTSK